MELVACIGTDESSWGQLTALINRGEWDKIIIVKSSDSTYQTPQGALEIVINAKDSIKDIQLLLNAQLKKECNEFDVCVSIASGTGKEHMALIAALLTIPVGIRFVAYTENGIEWLT